MAETADLVAAAVNGERFTGQGLPGEPGNAHAVPAGLARPNGVEEPDDNGFEAAFATVGINEALVDGFGLGVAPPRFERRAHDAVVILAEPGLGALAVDLAGRGGEEDRAVARRGVDDVLRAVNVGAQALEGAVADDERAHRCRQVIDLLASSGELADQVLVEDRALNQAEIAVIGDRAQIAQPPGAQVIQPGHLIAVGQQPLDEVRPDEPGRAGHEYLHHLPLADSGAGLADTFPGTGAADVSSACPMTRARPFAPGAGIGAPSRPAPAATGLCLWPRALRLRVRQVRRAAIWS